MLSIQASDGMWSLRSKKNSIARCAVSKGTGVGGTGWALGAPGKWVVKQHRGESLGHEQDCGHMTVGLGIIMNLPSAGPQGGF